MKFNNNTLQKYERNINNVINYINQNLSRQMTLEELSKIACFSKYHFHRIFKSIIGENVNEFIKRLQLEKAAHMLKFNHSKSITDIAFECGFSSSQNFAKSFKNKYFITPTQFIKLNSNIGNILSNNGKDNNTVFHYNEINKNNVYIKLKKERYMADKVKIKHLPDMKVAYIRQIGKYTPETLCGLFTTIVMWAGARNLLIKDSKIIGVCWDSTEITPDEKCRFDACVIIPPEYNVGKEVNEQFLKKGKFAVYSVVITNNDFQKYWDRLLKDWLPSSGYELDDRPSYEIFYNLTSDDSDERLITDICLPLK